MPDEDSPTKDDFHSIVELELLASANAKPVMSAVATAAKSAPHTQVQRGACQRPGNQRSWAAPRRAQRSVPLLASPRTGWASM